MRWRGGGGGGERVERLMVQGGGRMEGKRRTAGWVRGGRERVGRSHCSTNNAHNVKQWFSSSPKRFWA